MKAEKFRIGQHVIPNIGHHKGLMGVITGLEKNRYFKDGDQKYTQNVWDVEFSCGVIHKFRSYQIAGT